MRSRKLVKLSMLFLFLMFSIGAVFAQKLTIKGDIKTKEGKSIEAATIRVEGVNGSVTYTDSTGEFSILASKGNHLIVERVGYKPETIVVNPDNTFYNVVLEESSQSLDEVVITASGEMVKRRTQGYTSTTLNSKDLTMSKPQSVASALAGRVPGLDVSAVGGGVNPNYRLVMRGQRSITGNNNALIVLDNVIVPSDVLNNINPEDIETMTILNGAQGVALYGSQASNGALLVTTKKGKQGAPRVNISQTVTGTKVAFGPKYQKEFGSGGEGYGYDSNGDPLFESVENQSYGPRYDGSTRDLGYALEDGSQLTAKYSYFKDRMKFWQTGISNQSDFSISGADDKSNTMFSAQYLNSDGVTWLDNYKRVSVRLNGGRKFLDNLELNYAVNYVQNRYNTTSALSTVYDQFNNMPGWIPITSFKDWKNNKFANPNGYYNPWYPNPYFTIENNRSYTANDYLIGNISLKYAPTKWLTITTQTGFNQRTITTQQTTGKFNYTEFAKTSSGGSKTDIVGSDYEWASTNRQLFSNLYFDFHKRVNDFNFNLLLKADLQNQYYKYVTANVNGLSDSSIFNLSNTLNYPSASSNYYQARQYGQAYEFKVGYKNYLFLHTTGRRDVVSILDPSNRSFFYPEVDISFVASDAIPVLKRAEWLDVLKFRGGWSKVGQVNLSGYQFGAYALEPTFGQANGYPYSGVAGQTVSGTIVQTGLKPEITKGVEFGTDFTLFNNKVDGSFTYYRTITNNQTITTGVSNATGYQSYLNNAGATLNRGIETRLTVNIIDNANYTLSMTGTYAHQYSEVTELTSSLPRMSIASYTYAGSYAIAGMQFPQIYGTDYNRDDKGRVIVDKTTGLPSVSTTWVNLGNANPRHILGLTPSFRFKNFNISAVFEYRGGMKRYNSIGSSLAWSGMGINTVKYDRKPFVFPNSVYLGDDGTYVENKSIVTAYGGDNFWAQNVYTSAASNFVTNGAYWKLRQLSISYALPASILGKQHVLKSATISVQGRNLFLWMPKDNVYTDPEYSAAGSDSNGIGLTGYDAPPQRYYGATISLTF
ncbi:SusC/RagA family TonB-linked outer membrane protein [Rhizosphaericola mali]|uniref:SusC/RagA family TonB-linked outer membrane protein n=1 Tax=Rhizosphaericola mali TaxID=2545455 RepID=A0A5P2GFI3_9BACT|nr:SusC/RagA family TonB-linked outer membrane protein [Rhizosphaericola mali]QES90381.1 SusC/RagA family TonB-linked outer membrane protein [Rhizosphaericola mali]